MAKLTVARFVLSTIAVLLLLAAPARAAETLRLQLTTQAPGLAGHQCFGPRHLVIAWLENTGGHHVATLYSWGQNFLYNLKDWAQASGLELDALTGATPLTHIALDSGAIDITGIPDGTYSVELEMTECEVADSFPTARATFTFDKDGTAATQGPTDQGSFLGVVVTYSGRSGNSAPGVDAGPDLVVTPIGSPATASGTLQGSASDDSGSQTLSWQQLSSDPAGGAATFTDAAAAVTTVRFSQAGIYRLALQADDGSLTSSDTMTAYVNAQALVPAADAQVTSNNPTDNFGILRPAPPGPRGHQIRPRWSPDRQSHAWLRALRRELRQRHGGKGVAALACGLDPSAPVHQSLPPALSPQ